MLFLRKYNIEVGFNVLSDKIVNIAYDIFKFY